MKRTSIVGWRSRVDLYTPAEVAIRDAMMMVEQVGCHPLLTEAVVLLEHAKAKVQDYLAVCEAPKNPPNPFATIRPGVGRLVG